MNVHFGISLLVP